MTLWAAVILALALDQGPRESPRVQMANSQVEHRVRSAVTGAKLRLERQECQRILTDFRDVEGQPLIDRLASSGLAASAYLIDRVWFVDGADSPQCRTDGTTVAFTVPRHHVVRICTGRFGSSFEPQMAAAEIVVIHEMLHTLGLGENPPTSQQITEQVRRHCGKS